MLGRKGYSAQEAERGIIGVEGSACGGSNPRERAVRHSFVLPRFGCTLRHHHRGQHARVAAKVARAHGQVRGSEGWLDQGDSHALEVKRTGMCRQACDSERETAHKEQAIARGEYAREVLFEEKDNSRRGRERERARWAGRRGGRIVGRYK
eukprot:4182547-Pleurochrysis_carterae.AAC.2